MKLEETIRNMSSYGISSNVRNKLMTVRNGDDRVKLIIDGEVYSVILRDVQCKSGCVYKNPEIVVTTEVLCDTVGNHRTMGRATTINPDTYDPIEKVIFNDPATIVIWKDGSKTVVKVQDGDVYDPEKGLAMAISKKFFGNKGNYCDRLNKWLDKYHEECKVPTLDVSAKELELAFKKIEKDMCKRGIRF